MTSTTQQQHPDLKDALDYTFRQWSWSLKWQNIQDEFQERAQQILDSAQVLMTTDQNATSWGAELGALTTQQINMDVEREARIAMLGPIPTCSVAGGGMIRKIRVLKQVVLPTFDKLAQSSEGDERKKLVQNILAIEALDTDAKSCDMFTKLLRDPFLRVLTTKILEESVSSAMAD